MSKLFKSKFLLGALVFAFAFLATASFANAEITTTLKRGMKDAQVMELQQTLNGAGYLVSSTGAGAPGSETSYFGSRTEAAVMAFQSAMGLTVDGIVGPQTIGALMGAGTGTSTGTSTGTLPAGCTSTEGYSVTTGVKCDSSTTTTTTIPGCMTGYMYSPINGQACDGSTTEGTTQTGPVTAMIAATNPVSGTLVAGQATADLAHFAFTGTGTVTGVTLQRVGVSADTTPSNVYLFEGAARLTDAASVSSTGMVTFNNPAGLFTVAGTSTVAVKSDIAASTSGQTLGFKLVSFTTADGTVTTDLSGNVHTIAAATLASVSAGTVTPSGATINPAAGITVWQSTLTVSTRDVMMKRLSLRNIGSAPASSFANFKLFVNGAEVATATGVDADGYVTFDMMSAPVTLASGARVVRVDADVVSGASRTFQFSLRNAADVDFVDSSFGVNVAATSTPWTPGSANTISGATGGSLTIEKDTTSPSGSIAEGTNDVVLGVFKLTAYGEPIKVETLRATYASSDASVTELRNGKIMIDGQQYGSTSTLNEDSHATTAYTQYTLNYTVNPGTPVLVEIRADIYDNDGTDNISNSDTFTAAIAAGSSNAQRVDSLGSFNAPTTAVSANSMTVADATATLTENTTYADQSVALPSTAFKIGSWNLSGSSVDDILITTLSFDVDEVSGTTFNEDDITNMYVMLGGQQLDPIATVSATDNNFPVNYTLAKNSTVAIELYGNLGSTVSSTDSFKTDLTITGTAITSGAAVTATPADTDGQTIAQGTASITATQDASTPVAAVVYDNQTNTSAITSAAIKFDAVTAGYNVTDLTFTLANNTVATRVDLYDGETLVASRPGASTVTFNGLSWNVPANTNKVLTVKLNLSGIGVGAGTSGADLTTTLTSFTATNTSTGVSAAGTESNPAGNAVYAYAATPTITNVDFTPTTLGTGTQTVSKFSVASNGGTIGWKKIIFTVTRAMSGIDTLATPTLWDADTNTQIAGTAAFTGGVEADNGTSGTITFVATNEQQIAGTKTYVLKLVTAGTLVAGDNLNVSIAQPSSNASPAAYATVAGTTSSFTWTDVSATSHSATTTDWNNDYLIRNLPTDTQTLTK